MVWPWPPAAVPVARRASVRVLPGAGVVADRQVAVVLPEGLAQLRPPLALPFAVSFLVRAQQGRRALSLQVCRL